MDTMGLQHFSAHLVVCFILASFSSVSAQGEGSCVGRCGQGYFRGDPCHCDFNCMIFLECCPDFKAVCTTENSCKGRCHDGFERGRDCDCDSNCVNYGKCCSDYEAICAKPIQRRSPPQPPPPPALQPSDDEKENPPEPTMKPKEDSEEKTPEAPKQNDEPLPKKKPKANSRTPRNKKDDRLTDPGDRPRDSDDGTAPSPGQKNPQKKNKKPSPKKPRKKTFIIEYEDPEDYDDETEDYPSTSKNKKRPKKKKPKNPIKKIIKSVVESEEEEEIQESEENLSSTSFSSSSSSSSVKGSKKTKKLSKKNQKKNPPNDDDENPDTADPKKKRPPLNDDKDRKPKKPKTRKIIEDDEDPDKSPKDKNPKKFPPNDKDGKPKKPNKPKLKDSEDDDPDGDPTKKRPPTGDDGKPKRRKTTTIIEEESEKNPKESGREPKKKVPSLPDDNKGKPKKPKIPGVSEDEDNPDGPPGGSPENSLTTPPFLQTTTIKTATAPNDLAENPLLSTSKNTTRPKTTNKRSPSTVNKKKKKVIIPNDDTDEPSKPKKGKKNPKKPPSKEITKKKKLQDSEEERKETRLSEFSSSSQSSSSHRRSKSSSRRLSGKNKKNIKEKNKKKFPPEPITIKPKKSKNFTPTPTPEGSGDEGSGMDFWTTTSTTLLSTEDLKSTARTIWPDGRISSTAISKTENSVEASTTTTLGTETFTEQGTTPSLVSSEERTLRMPTMMTVFTQHSTTSEGKTKTSFMPTDNTIKITSSLTTLQEQTTTDNNVYNNSNTTNVQGLHNSTSTVQYSSVSTIPTKEPASSTISEMTSKQTTNVQHSTVKASQQPDTSFGPDGTSLSPQQSLITQSHAPSPSSNPLGSNDNSISTKESKTNVISSSTTAIPLQTSAPSGSQTDMSQKETVSKRGVTEPIQIISTSLSFEDSGPQKTTVSPPKILHQGTTISGEARKQTTEQPQRNLISTLPVSTVKQESESENTYTTEDTGNGATPIPKNIAVVTKTMIKTPNILDHTTNMPNIEESTKTPRAFVTARLIGVEEMVNINKTSYTLPLDPDHICNILREKAIRLGISGSDLQQIIDICMEMQHQLTPVSTQSTETKKYTPDQRRPPPRHPVIVTPPQENQHPESRLIQIVHEINRRINIPPITDLERHPNQNQNKSTIWMMLYDKIRNPIGFQPQQDPQMNICKGPPADGMTTLQNGSMVVFRGHYFWTLNDGGAQRPRKISEVWGIPSPIDTVFTRCNCGGKTFFFKGPNYWRFTNHIMDPGYPKQIIKGFGGLGGKITAVLSVAGHRSRPESVYFIKSGGRIQKYTYRQEQTSKCNKKPQPPVRYPIYSHNIQTVKYRYPRNVVRHQIQIRRSFTNLNQTALGVLHEETTIRSTWRGVPNNIISAVSLPNPQKQDGFDYYVFSKEKYYNINMSSRIAIKPPPNAEQKTTKDWYKCKE